MATHRAPHTERTMQKKSWFILVYESDALPTELHRRQEEYKHELRMHGEILPTLGFDP